MNADPGRGADLELVVPLSKSFLDGQEEMEGISVIQNPDIFRPVYKD